MKQTHHIGYVQTPSVKNLSNVKNALVENGLVSLTTPNEMLPDAIEKGLVEFEKQILEKNKDYGAIYNNKYRVRYFDADGTILKIEYVAEGGKLTPPDNPNFKNELLVFDDWNYDVENYIVEQPTDIGAIYDTINGKTILECKLTKGTGMKVNLAISGHTSIDWGDGTVDTNTSHTYAKDGYYLIQIEGNITFGSGSTTYLMGSDILNKSLNACFFSNNVEIITNAFKNCYNCNIITFAKNNKIITESALSYCMIETVIIPKNMTINSYGFTYNSSLKNLILSEATTSIYQYTFRECSNLENIVLPPNLTTIDKQAFNSCEALKKLVIPKSLTKMDIQAFVFAYTLSEVLIFSESVIIPSSSSNYNYALGYEGTTYFIKDAIIDSYKTYAKWSKYASQMKPLSWYPSLTDPNAE